MITDTPCPDAHDLQRFLLGLSGAPDLGEHFGHCPQCLRRAADVEVAGDPLADAVRDVPINSTVEIPDGMFERLRDIGRERLRDEPAAAGERVGPYQIERVLGRGGMGTVYLARHDRLSRPVALKLLPAGASPDRVARFRREAEAVAALRHPGVVQVHEVGEADSRPYMAMEFVPGGTLAARLAAAPLPPAEAARVVEAVARAVAAAHTAGVIHRDLKPENVLLDPAGVPKVADFGLAKYREGAASTQLETQTGALLGTPAYMAPEQAAGAAEAGPAADVYGLGAILYECLTGRPPFKAATVLETLDQVRHQEPVRPRQLQPGVPKDLENLCLKCLEKAPNRRYPSGGELADDLGRFLRGESVRARPVGPARRTWKWARRRPTAAALLAACALSVAALAVVIAVYTTRLRSAIGQANTSAAEAERQRGLAANNYRAARDALRRMLRRLDDRKAADIPRLRELREELLEDALAFYESVLAGLDDPNPEVRLDAALALAEVGSLQFQLGRTDMAGPNLRRALSALEQLPPAYRTRPDARTGVIHCCAHLANLHPSLGESEGWLRRALAEAEELYRDDPADPLRENGVARAEHNLAQHFQGTRREADAAAHYRRAIEIRTGVIARHPGEHAYRADLAVDLLNLGLFHLGHNRPGEAGDAFHRAEGLLRPLLEEDPADDGYALSLAGVYVNWGNLLRAQGDLPGAQVKYDRAVELADAALAREPRYAEARARSLQAHGARAMLSQQLGKLADAAADYDHVVACAPEPERNGFRVARALLKARAGMHVWDAAEGMDLAAVPGLTDDTQYFLVSALALCVGPARADPTHGFFARTAAAEVYATTAVGLLHRLFDHGYFRNPENARFLALDTDLNSLRDRPDFLQLLREVAGPP